MRRIMLGVNIDHVATLREQRGTRYPDPVTAAAIAELAGADQITVHLREDRRHMQDRDLDLLRATIQTRLNLEMAATEEIALIALKLHPDQVSLVPERREERTTEGGLDVAGHRAELSAYVRPLLAAGIRVITFVDPDPDAIKASADIGAHGVELHTGDFCGACEGTGGQFELDRLSSAARLALTNGMCVAAGHGLDYVNVERVCAIEEIAELNIGHSIIARAVLVGMDRAVREMRAILARYQR